jgi:MtN3 and saliva related transmembrane protein
VAPADRRKKKAFSIHNIIKLIFMSLIQILGLAAGTITSITFLPQVIQIWKTKSAKDLSLMMLLLLILGVLLWLTYGLLVMDAAIIYTNSMVLAMSLILLYFKLRFK